VSVWVKEGVWGERATRSFSAALRFDPSYPPPSTRSPPAQVHCADQQDVRGLQGAAHPGAGQLLGTLGAGQLLGTLGAGQLLGTLGAGQLLGTPGAGQLLGRQGKARGAAAWLPGGRRAQGPPLPAQPACQPAAAPRLRCGGACV